MLLLSSVTVPFYPCIFDYFQPKVIGMSSLPLKSILQANALFLDRTLEVRDRSQAVGCNSSSLQENAWPLVGQLKVRNI